MNRPEILDSVPSGGSIDGIDFHDLGMLVHAIDSRGMPPISPRRIERPGSHGAIILSEYYRPRPLTVSGQMFADTHAELIENQTALRAALARFSRARRGTPAIYLIDPLEPSTSYECVYNGSCIFGDPSPREVGTACRFVLSLLANPPWRQGPVEHVSYTAQAARRQNIPVGDAESSYRIILSNFTFPLSFRWGGMVGRLVPLFSLDMETDAAALAPQSAPALSALSPSPLTSGQKLPLSGGQKLRYDLNLYLGGMSAFFVLSSRIDSSHSGAVRYVASFANGNTARGDLQVQRQGNATVWRLRLGSQILTWAGPAHSVGDRICVGWTAGGNARGYQPGMTLYMNGQPVRNVNVATGNDINRVYIGSSQTANFSAEMDLHFAGFFAHQMTDAEHLRANADPESFQIESVTTQLVAPSGVTSGDIQFDTESYTGKLHTSAGEVLDYFPDDNTFLPPLIPGQSVVRHNRAVDVSILYRKSYL